MKPSNLDKSMSNTILNQVHEGMRVCDNTGDEIGTVRQLFLGEVSEETNERGGGPATAATPELRGETILDYVAKAFADEPLPETLRDRLLRHGFIISIPTGCLPQTASPCRIKPTRSQTTVRCV
jgi:hypothetical protein